MGAGRRLSILWPVLALDACSAAKDPLDELAVGERGLWEDGVWPIHEAAAPPSGAERFEIAEGVSGVMVGSEARFAVCDLALQGPTLILESGKPAAELCQLPGGTGIRAPSFLSDGRLEVSHPLNLEKRD